MIREARARRRLALVEDEADFRAALKFWLRPVFEVAAFASAEDFLADGPRKPLPDLIIADVNLPGLDGFGLCAALRKDPRRSRIPVLLLTGLTVDKGLFKGQAAGVCAYLTKPIERENLLEQIDKLLDARAL